MTILRYNNVNWSIPFLFGYDIELISIIALHKNLGVSFNVNSFGAPKSK